MKIHHFPDGDFAYELEPGDSGRDVPLSHIPHKTKGGKIRFFSAQAIHEHAQDAMTTFRGPRWYEDDLYFAAARRRGQPASPTITAHTHQMMLEGHKWRKAKGLPTRHPGRAPQIEFSIDDI